MPRRPLLSALAFLTLLLPLAAQAPPAKDGAKETQARIQKKAYDFKDAGKEMEYALFVPSTYDRAKPAPLVVALHGLGSNPQQILRYRGMTDLAEKYGFVVAAPMGYNSRGWYGAKALIQGKNDDPANLAELSEKDVMNVLDIVRKDYAIDPDRVYLLGHSMGGGGTWHLALKHPDLFAALAPIAPATSRPATDLEKIKHVPVILVQGDQDRLVPVAAARRWTEQMKTLKMDYEYVEVAGGDHIAPAFSELPKVFAFFAKHQRGAKADQAGDAPPRYKLTPGRRLDYVAESAFKAEDGKPGDGYRTRKAWTGWALRANPDGSTRLLMREVDEYTSINGGKERTNDPRTQVSYADVFPDGRALPNPTTRFRGGPAEVLPPLAKTPREVKAGWEVVVGDGKVVAKPLPGGRFVAETFDFMDKVYLSSRKSTYTFDAARGVVTTAEVETAQGYGFVGKATGTLKLTADATLPADELAKLAADADRYFPAVSGYDDALEAAGKLPPAKATAALAAALDAVKAAADAVTQPDLKTALADRVKAHDRQAGYVLAEAKRRDQFVGKPAFAFDAADLAGKPVKLADFRGKVVVLDFWYRGCGWCVRAMPQMNQLTADFAGEPVAILGMNTDAEKADAEFVVKAIALKYPTVCVEHAMAAKYGVQGFPTLVLIDRAGVVRDLHVGYSPTLRDDVGKAVRALLAEKPE